jgi:tetratricopeptide (TPR) repeat protein
MTVNLFKGPAQQAGELAHRVRRGARGVRVADGKGKPWLLHETAQRLGSDSVVIHVPRDLDKIAYVLLTAAAQCGMGPLTQTASRLASHQADPGEALDVLSQALGNRPVLVSNLDALANPAEDVELRDVFKSSLDRVHEWLKQRADIATTYSLDSDVAFRQCIDEPNPSSQWDAQLLWKRVGQDVDLYTLAVARALLLGISADEPGVGWTADSITGDLWREMPLEMRELVSLLAVHERPVHRGQFEDLKLVASAVIDMAVAANLVEESREALWLTAPRRWSELLPPTVRSKSHQRLAEAFARVARQADSPDAAPLAVLEAHRHYAAIPDVKQALEFARFGVGQILASARGMSFDGLFDRASRAYDMVLRLDEQVRAGGEPQGIGKRARAYALHYRAFNRYRGRVDEPLETLGRYREALALWPENALFWSRTIRCCFIAERYEEGMNARDDALLSVPEHPRRADFLIRRTVERLLRRDLVLAAVLTWGDYRVKEKELAEQEVKRQLLARTSQGWSECRLLARGAPALRLRTPVEVRITEQEKTFTCHLLGHEEEGSSPEKALAEAVRALFSELLEIMEDPAPSPERARRKLELTALVDFEALRLGGEAARWIAYLATLERSVERGETRPEQKRCLVDTWSRIRQALPDIRRPAVGRTEEARVALSWSFADRPQVVLTIDIEPDGRVDWFYRDAERGVVRGTEEEPEAALPEEVIQLLTPFAS